MVKLSIGMLFALLSTNHQLIVAAIPVHPEDQRPFNFLGSVKIVGRKDNDLSGRHADRSQSLEAATPTITEHNDDFETVSLDFHGNAMSASIGIEEHFFTRYEPEHTTSILNTQSYSFFENDLATPTIFPTVTNSLAPGPTSTFIADLVCFSLCKTCQTYQVNTKKNPKFYEDALLQGWIYRPCPNGIGMLAIAKWGVV